MTIGSQDTHKKKKFVPGRALFVAAPALLAACSAFDAPPVPPAQVWEKPDHVPPEEVRAALPPGVGVDAIIVRRDPGPGGPCYYYIGRFGKRHPVVTAEMASAGINDAPYCIM